MKEVSSKKLNKITISEWADSMENSKYEKWFNVLPCNIPVTMSVIA